jgi:hypothetical protein
MAKQHTTNTNGVYINPEVRYERTDIEIGTIAKYGIGLVVLVVSSIGVSWWLFGEITRYERKSKLTDLPPAAVDAADGLPPEPRLEAFEDLKKHNVKLMPPRARDSYVEQEKLLAEGDAKLGILSIEKAIDGIKLPSRKGNAAPESFPPHMPSKAAAGRDATGGER